MKKYLLTTIMSFVFMITYSQDSQLLKFKAVNSSMYTLGDDGKWELYQKNGSVNIPIELDKDILSKNIFYGAISKIRKNNYNTDGVLELIVLSYMFPYPIVVYDNYNEVKYIFSSGPVSVNEKTINKSFKLARFKTKFLFQTKQQTYTKKLGE